MKILRIVLVVLTFALVHNKNNLMGTEQKQIAKVDHILDVPLHTALPNDGFTLQHQAGFKNALILEKIPGSINNNLNQGIIEEPNTFATDKNYYDGSMNLSAIHVTCNIYTTNPHSCVKQSGCGWCGEKNTCISGNFQGPLAPCLRNTFLFQMPSPEWSPLKAGTINILAVDKKGQPQNHITPEPNLAKVDVFNPYK